LFGNLDQLMFNCKEVTEKGTKMAMKVLAMTESQLLDRIMTIMIEIGRLNNLGKLHYDNKRYFEAGESYGQILDKIINQDQEE